MEAHYKWMQVGDLLVNYATAGTISDKVWNDFIKDLKTLPINKYLTAANGTTEPNSLQRKMAVDILKSRKIMVAVVTDDKIVRGLVTAAGWFGATIKAFPWNELHLAMRYLNIPESMDSRVVAVLGQLKASCGQSRLK